MRDWPEPDQDTTLDILETWDLGDYEEARAEHYYEEVARAEETKINVSNDDNPYTDWEPPDTCACCDTEYCQSMANEALGDQYYDEYAEREKTSEKPWQEVCIAQSQADTARLESAITQAKANIIQAQANVARITAGIAVAKSEIAKANYHIVAAECVEEDYHAHNWLATGKTNLINAEANLIEAKIVLANARMIGAAYDAVVIAQKNVENMEARVQDKKDTKDLAIEIKETCERDYHVEELNLLDKGAHIEYILFPEQQNGIIEIGYCCEAIHIEYVNAVIDLAEAKDALDLAEILLAKTPSLSLIRGYGFANCEPRCPTSDIAE